MKENNFYSDDFEQLIRGKTEQYKMYPSENVWKGVHNALHTKRKWFIGSMAALVTGILFFAGRELIAPSPRLVVLHRPASAVGAVTDETNDQGNGISNDGGNDGGNDAAKSSASGASGNTDLSTTAPLAAIRSSNYALVSARRDAGSGDTEERDAAYMGLSITLGHPVLTQSDLSEWLSHVVKLPAEAPDLAVITERKEDGKDDPAKGATDNISGQSGSNQNGVASTLVVETGMGRRASGEEQGSAEEASSRGVVEALSARGAQHSRLQGTNAGRTGVTGKDRLPESASSGAKAVGSAIAEADDAQRVNWLQDYAMNVLDASPKHGRTYLQLTLAPTINYRSLGGNNVAAEKFPASGPNAYLLNNPQGLVGHSPAVGFEVGGSILYRVTRNLSLKGGLQFNFNRYPMQAYVSRTSGALNSNYAYVMDSLNGNRRGTPETIDNDYFQLSVPLGFELRVLGNEKLQFNIGGTIQPSYLLNTNSYMLTEDYHDYNKAPSKFRRLNVSGGIEAFLTYRMGDIRWQIGPEFRYQLLSSYISQYPITENLKGYGLKIGITKMLP